MTVVKICGLTVADDALAAVDAGADWLGLNFFPGSKRCVTPERGREIARQVRAVSPATIVVGVFVNASRGEILAVEDLLDYIQLHGDETPEQCEPWGARAIKAVWLSSPKDVEDALRYPVQTLLVDTPSEDRGGSGVTGDWSLARSLCQQKPGRHILLAGGLVAENVAAAVAAVRPFGVDVASGVEQSPGRKDRDKMRRFIEAVRGAS